MCRDYIILLCVRLFDPTPRAETTRRSSKSESRGKGSINRAQSLQASAKVTHSLTFWLRDEAIKSFSPDQLVQKLMKANKTGFVRSFIENKRKQTLLSLRLWINLISLFGTTNSAYA